MAKSSRFSKKPAVGVPTKTNNNLPVILGASSLVVVLLIIAIVLTVSGGSDNSDSAEKFEYQPVTINGGPLPPEYASGDSSNQNIVEATGNLAPDLLGKSFTGETVDIKNDGKPKVVTFFAHW